MSNPAESQSADSPQEISRDKSLSHNHRTNAIGDMEEYISRSHLSGMVHGISYVRGNTKYTHDSKKKGKRQLCCVCAGDSWYKMKLEQKKNEKRREK